MALTPSEITAHIRTWAKLNAQEVYGSSRDFVNIRDLTNELDKIDAASERI